MTFGAPIWLWGIAALPALAVIFAFAERRTAQRLRDFVAPRLLPQLTATVDRFRRAIRFGLQLIALGFAFIALAQPRWGYIYEDTKRKGIDLLMAIDTSRSMLSNDVQPNRLERVKLAAQDLINELQGDRIGLIAFAGRAFLQAPLTIDYDAAVEAINDLDTKSIPEGGTNISEAIILALNTYGKSAVGNRALVIFTDGEELSGDAVKAAKVAADAGVKIFTIGVGTAQGSLIPLPSDDGGSSFVKDNKGQVVKSKLDENRLREVSQKTGGFYLHLENGPRTMHQLFTDGLATMTAKEMDVRLSRRPIERYEWPLSAAAVLLAFSILMRDRKRVRARSFEPAAVKLAPAAAALLLFSLTTSFGSISGLNFYETGKYPEAYEAFQEDFKNHPNAPDKDKIQFDAGTAAYQMHDYNKAAEAFSQALLSDNVELQSKSHFNLGNTLYRRGESLSNDKRKLTDWTDALRQYEETLKINSTSKEAKENYEFVKKKIEELKNKPQSAKPSPPPEKPKEPSEAAKRAKAEADKAVRQRQYEKAYDIMIKQLSIDMTTYYYADYIQRLEAINGIKKSVVEGYTP